VCCWFGRTPGPLNEEEYAEMKEHVNLGTGLVGEEISEEGRIPFY